MRFSTIAAIAAVTALLYTAWGSTAVQSWMRTRGFPSSERALPTGRATPGAEGTQLSSGAWRSRFRKIHKKLEQFETCRETMPDECRGKIPSDCRGLLYKPDGYRIRFSWDRLSLAACAPLEEALLDAEAAWRDEQQRLDFEATRAGIPQSWRN